jgi:hypothetical protein
VLYVVLGGKNVAFRTPGNASSRVSLQARRKVGDRLSGAHLSTGSFTGRAAKDERERTAAMAVRSLSVDAVFRAEVDQ